jgi:hypothetical protein
MEQKQRFKFNIADIAILFIIIAAAAFFVNRYAIRPGSAADPSRQLYPFEMVLDSFDLSNDRFEGKIKEGDTLIDRNTGVRIGKITSIETKETRTYAETAEGEIKLAPRELSSWLTLTVEGKGFRHKDGGLVIDALHVYSNKEHELTINDSAFFLRVVSFVIGE